MVTGQNDDFYCPRCGVSDNLQQTVKHLGTECMGQEVEVEAEWYEFNCGVCKFKTYIGVTNE